MAIHGLNKLANIVTTKQVIVHPTFPVLHDILPSCNYFLHCFESEGTTNLWRRERAFGGKQSNILGIVISTNQIRDSVPLTNHICLFVREIASCKRKPP